MHPDEDVRGGSLAATLEEPTRARREPLTKRRIVRSALRIMDEEGLEAVTMRRIGRDLGVEAMSLYNHVRDKDEILQAVCEEVLAGFRLPPIEGWADAIRQTAHEYRRLLLAHPNVITLMTHRKSPITNPDSLAVYEFALDLFRTAGLSVADAVMAFHAFGGYILGYVAMELGPMVGGTQDDAHAAAQEQMVKLVASANLPRIGEALPYFAECDVEAQFEFGLDLLIGGIQAKIAGSA